MSWRRRRPDAMMAVDSRRSAALPSLVTPADAASRPSWSAVQLHDREFEILRRLIHAETGISLAPTKRVLLEPRLSRRLRALGMDSFASYCAYLATGLDAELVPLINCVTT